MARKLALLIGNDQYEDAKFTGLTVPQNDIVSLKTVLQRPDIGAFDQVETLINESSHVARRVIANFYNNKNKDDLILLYFSGHGILDIHGDLYLAMKDTNFDHPLGISLESQFINTAMNKSRSRRQVLILDCCHSGAFKRGTKGLGAPAVTEQTFEVSGYGREILTSSTATQLSWQGEQVIGDTDKSLFTHYLIEGLETGKAAASGAKQITVGQLYDYAHDHVVKEKPEMKPQRWVDKQQGALVIAQNPNPKVQVKVLPVELQDALNDKRHYVRIGAIRDELGRWLKSDDESEVLAAKQTLAELNKRERDYEVRQVIDDMLAKAIPDKSYSQKIVQTAEDDLSLDQKEILSKKIEKQKLITGSVFQDTLKDGSKGPKMVVIPAGEFWMGSPDDEEVREDIEGPRHKVIIKKSFAMGQYVVTFEEYDKFSIATGRENPEDEGWGRDNRPVINVSWEDVKAYTRWLSEQIGQHYRLPSEAEWEYAARAGTETPFHFGETINTDQANYNGKFTYTNGSKGECRFKTLSVGSFPANDFGLYDVHGNVWEWTEDCYHDNYNKAPDDGSAWISGECQSRVLRGGSWGDEPWNLRSAFRYWFDASYRDFFIGFRLARDL